MGVAYSPPDKVIHAEIPAHNSECLRLGLHEAVTLAGWEVDRTVDNGYVYILTSPQDDSLQCKVRIDDTGSRAHLYSGVPLVELQFLSMDETYQSHKLGLKYATWASGEPAPRRLRVHVGPCQIFTYYAGIKGAANSVMGGIPWIDPNALASTAERCAEEDNGLQTSQAWWCCSDFEQIFRVYGVDTLRTHWRTGQYSTLHNSTLYVVDSAEKYYSDSLLRLLPTNRPEEFWDRYGTANDDSPVIMRWLETEEPMYWDPLIAWSTAHPVVVRGQLWDAVVRTQWSAWETPLTFEGLPFFSYSNGEAEKHIYRRGDLHTLCLRDSGLIQMDCEGVVPTVTTGSNYAY